MTRKDNWRCLDRYKNSGGTPMGGTHNGLAQVGRLSLKRCLPFCAPSVRAPCLPPPMKLPVPACSVLLPLLPLLLTPLQVLQAAPLNYNREVRPVLSDNCFACHGPDPGNRKADLRLDQPGTFEREEFLKRVFTTEKDEVMPPPKSHKQLSVVQKGLLKRWVEEGAKVEPHWSFVPPAKGASGTCIDDFIRAELPRHGLKGSPRAEPSALVRRVALDLTGLPPTPQEQLRFAAAGSHAAMVDYFLAQPAFGEHMAVGWMDAARYADTNGYQVDRDRELWPWRDWVVRAFNANMPFDQFTVEQLAGDLLPNPTLDQRIATGFHRNHMLNEEGGVIAEEFLAEYTADRVETTAAVWLGQTFACCRCHDHKYDPFTQRDFYALKAYFHNVPERGVGIYSNPVRTNAPPFVRLPAPEVEAKIKESNAKLSLVEEKKKSFDAADLETWAASLAAAEIQWVPLVPVAATGGDQAPQVLSNAVIVGPQESRSNDIRITVKMPPGKLVALRVECATEDPSASFQWSELKAGKATLRALDAAHQPVLDNDRRTRVPLSVTPGKPAVVLFGLESSLDGAEAVIMIGVENAGGTTAWSISATTSEADQVAPDNIRALAKNEPAKWTAAQRKQLLGFRLSLLPEYRLLGDEETSLRKEIAAAEAEIPTTLVMEEQAEQRPTFVLMRGAYDKPGERVTAETPAVLPKPSEDLPKNRLGLARWLVSPDNPLTARVVVNRIWQHFFGAGIVRSSEDFGAQGDLPSHPELLDWLAVTFQESGWDVKHLIKLIVTSESYCQSSKHGADAVSREMDPANTWISRGPRHRLPAEAVRDQILAASGLLVRKIGGPAVKPYHPTGLYEQVVAQRDNPQATYKQGHGEDLYRRSLYTYWKRSVPHPAMLLFDAPFREVCAMRRSRSNTPLQALNLMNDPAYVEASRFLAQRMINEGGDQTESRIAHGFRLLLARAPEAREIKVLTAALQRALQDFKRDPDAAAQLLEVGETKNSTSIPAAELAAFTTIASTLMNLDEAITKE